MARKPRQVGDRDGETERKLTVVLDLSDITEIEKAMNQLRKLYPNRRNITRSEVVREWLTLGREAWKARMKEEGR